MVTPGSKQAKGFAIQISLLLANIPNLELGASSEFPDSKILTKKTVHRFVSINDRDGAEEAAGAIMQRAASKKRPAADVGAAVPKKKRTSKRKLSLETVVVAQEAVPIQSVHVSTVLEPMVEDQQAEFCTDQPADELPAARSAASTEERHWFNLSYEELIAKWAAERQITSPADSYDDIKDDKPVVNDPETIINQVLQNLDSASDDKDVEPVVETATMDVVTAGEDQQVQEFLAQNANDDLLDADEQKSLEDILLEIPVDVPLPSAGMEITKIVMGKTIKIPGVTEKSWFLNSLPRIPADDKGKEICLKKLATINIDEMYKKEEQVLSWGETESPQVSIQRKSYILLKYRKVLIWKFLESWRSNFVPGQGSSAVDRRVIELLSDRHASILEELTTTTRAHGLIWKKPCCSTVFEGSPRDRGAVIARTNTNTRSSCWIRMMILVDGVWTVEPCADKWVKIPRQVISNEVHRQRQYDDTLPTVSNFFRLMRKRWADICLEVVEFCASRRLLPIGSLQFCRSSTVVESDFRVAPHPSQIFAFRVSHFCSIFIDFSVFNWFPSADISDFLSSIALERTASRSVQRSFAPTVVSSVQFSLDQRPSSPTTADSSSSLRFDTTDVDATASSLPPVSQDVSAALADFQGESGSRGLQQPSNVQIEGSAVRPVFAQRVEMAQRHIVHTVLDADANRELLERQAAAERDRERRRRETRMLKRRRRD
ncbi:pentatricopeptide repeat-containing protein mitochondrial [Dorcoceras hygrometricum]|uniref:Pentatricopeptide repeat-containing protein mitochondrial n=1 Tax=Dorcoceras hygrometricum TaxID=472368 RepID=A0A2Z7A5C1_9LAMI|nr:pentatricopeptide repeat-containing protein mitochondrial [Dorcoceras hygrometricum]